MATATTAEADRLAILEEKIDALTDQIHFLAETARDSGLRRAQWDDLRSELNPVMGEAFVAVSKELDDVREFVEPADLWRLAKRVARNAELIEKMFDQLEGLSDLGADVVPLGRDMFLSAMARLDEMERKGYFAFGAGAMNVMDKVVTSFSTEDIADLGENVVLILKTVKEMTRPEVMQLLQRTAQEVRQAEVEEIGLIRLMWGMRNPAVRRGMSRMLRVLESFADVKPAAPGDREINRDNE
jgi:uncharacterized protein YjgD (DUF1641 family)